MADNHEKTITFHYIKASDYKVHEVHGGIGGMNAHGQIIMNLYFERGPIPRNATYKINENGQLEADPIDLDTKEGAVRDILFGLALSPENAKSLAKWLNNQADQMESLLKDEGEPKNE